MVLYANMKSDSGYSLNDILHTGKNLQGDFFRIILNFRLFAIAITADIKKCIYKLQCKKNAVVISPCCIDLTIGPFAIV